MTITSELRGYRKMGAHLMPEGARFAVWAPGAAFVSVIGDFNSWDLFSLPLQPDGDGVWQATVPGVRAGDRYKYHVHSRFNASRFDIPDPYAFCTEALPGDASRVWDLDAFRWADDDWIRSRSVSPTERPLSIYEIHAGSWMRVPEDGNRWTTWREIADKLPDYAHENGYTHVEFLPVAEYSASDPQGYSTTAYFAPSGRFGTPDGFMHLVHTLHRRGIGVILDWTAAALPRQAQYGDLVIDNALFWLDRYHIDGLRVVTAPEDSDSLNSQRQLKERIWAEYPSTIMIADQFGFEWSRSWMREVLAYMSIDPAQRGAHYRQILPTPTDSQKRNFVLPVSHEEVSHGRGSLIRRMPGDDWRKFANLRLLYGYVFAHPGKKIMFMGSDFGQWAEWNPDASLDWHLLSQPAHRGLLRWVRDLNTMLRGEPALYDLDNDPAGLEWIESGDTDLSIVTFIRKSREPGDAILFVFNFTPATHHNYRVGAPTGGFWKEILNGDAQLYGGSGQGNMGGVEASPLPVRGQSWSLSATVPPLAVVAFKPSERQ